LIIIAVVACGGDGSETASEDSDGYCPAGTASLQKSGGDIVQARNIFNSNLDLFDNFGSLNDALETIHTSTDDYELIEAYTIPQADALIDQGYSVAMHILIPPYTNSNHWIYVDDIYPVEGGYMIVCYETDIDLFGKLVFLTTAENVNQEDVIQTDPYQGDVVNYFVGYRLGWSVETVPNNP